MRRHVEPKSFDPVYAVEAAYALIRPARLGGSYSMSASSTESATNNDGSILPLQCGQGMGCT